MPRMESIRLAVDHSMNLQTEMSTDSYSPQSHEGKSETFNCIDWSQSPQPYYRLAPMKELGIHLSNFTIATWVRIDKFARTGAGFDETNTILGQIPYRKDRNLIVGVKQRRMFFSFTDDDTYGQTELRARQWYHVAFVYDLAARTQTIYLNGKRDGHGDNRGPTATTGNLFIGACENSRKLNGAMAELHIYTHSLSQHDIRRLIERDQCGYQQVTPHWTSFYNVYDENLPSRPTDCITDSHVITMDAFQSTAPEVKIINPYPAPNIRSTFLPSNGKSRSLVACTCCNNAMDLLNSRAALKMNIDYFSNIDFKVVYASYKVSLRYQGPIFRLRRADDDVELDFFSDNEGNLSNQSQSNSFEAWSNGSEAYVVTWYSQTGDSHFNANQPVAKKQPRYNGVKKLVEFFDETYLEMNPHTLPGGNGSYTYIVKHGEIHNPRGGLFGVGRGSSPYCGVSLQRLPLHSSYRSYWIDNDHQFTGYHAGNEVFEIYDAEKEMRVGGVNGKVTSELNGVPKRDLKTSKAVLGKGLEYQGMSSGNYHMNGEMEYFITSYQPMSPNEIARLYQPGMKIYDECLACPHCDALFKIDSLRNISHIAIRFNEKCIEELNFCYTRGFSQRQFVKKLNQSITASFRLRTKIDERIARVVFQQTQEQGLINIFFVTNLAKQSDLYGGAWIFENAEHITYAYTAPALTGGIAGLLLSPIHKVLAAAEAASSNDESKENARRSLNRGSSDFKERGKSMNGLSRESTARSDKFKQQQQNKVVTGIILRNGRVFKISLNPVPPKPTILQRIFCCTSKQAVVDNGDFVANSNKVEDMDKRLGMNGFDQPVEETYSNNRHPSVKDTVQNGQEGQYEDHEVDHFQEQIQQQEQIDHVSVPDINVSMDDPNEQTQEESTNEDDKDRDASISSSAPPSVEKAKLSIDIFPDDSPRASHDSGNGVHHPIPHSVSKSTSGPNSALPPRIPKGGRATPSATTSPVPLQNASTGHAIIDSRPPTPGGRNAASPVIPLGKRGTSPAIPMLPPANYRSSSPANSVINGIGRTNSFMQPGSQTSGKVSTSRPSSINLQQPSTKTSFLAKLSFYSQKGSTVSNGASVAQICDGIDFVDTPEQDLDDDDDDEGGGKGKPKSTKPELPPLDDDDDDDDEITFKLDPSMASSDIHDIVYVGNNTSKGVQMVWLQDEFSNVYAEDDDEDCYVDYFDLAQESSTSFFDFGNDRPMSAQMFDMSRDSMRFSFSKSDTDEAMNTSNQRGLRPSVLESSAYLNASSVSSK